MVVELFHDSYAHAVADRLAMALRHLCAEFGLHILKTPELASALDYYELEELKKCVLNGEFRKRGEYADQTHIRLMATLINTPIVIFAENNGAICPKGIVCLPYPYHRSSNHSNNIYLRLHGSWNSGHFQVVKNVIPRVRLTNTSSILLLSNTNKCYYILMDYDINI